MPALTSGGASRRPPHTGHAFRGARRVDHQAPLCRRRTAQRGDGTEDGAAPRRPGMRRRRSQTRPHQRPPLPATEPPPHRRPGAGRLLVSCDDLRADLARLPAENHQLPAGRPDPQPRPLAAHPGVNDAKPWICVSVLSPPHQIEVFARLRVSGEQRLPMWRALDSPISILVEYGVRASSLTNRTCRSPTRDQRSINDHLR